MSRSMPMWHCHKLFTQLLLTGSVCAEILCCHFQFCLRSEVYLKHGQNLPPIPAWMGYSILITFSSSFSTLFRIISYMISDGCICRPLRAGSVRPVCHRPTQQFHYQGLTISGYQLQISRYQPENLSQVREDSYVYVTSLYISTHSILISSWLYYFKQWNG